MIINSAREMGALVKDTRIKLGLSQEILATRVGVSRNWILQLEQGKPTVHLGLVLRTLKELNIHLHNEMSPPLSHKTSTLDLSQIIKRHSEERP